MTSKPASGQPPAPKPPVPVPQPESDRYWEGLRRSEIWVRRCDECSRAYFYPRDICPHCGSAKTQWFRASGSGELHTYAIVHRAPHPGFGVPYIVAIVELEEGVRIPTNLVEVEPEPANIKIGAKVAPVFEKLNDTITLLKFKLA